MSASGSTTNWAKVSEYVGDFISAVMPIIAVAQPELPAALTIGMKIIQGVLSQEPAAIALYNTITSGSTPTPEELASYASQYETAYQKLNDDINKKLATLSN